MAPLVSLYSQVAIIKRPRTRSISAGLGADDACFSGPCEQAVKLHYHRSQKIDASSHYLTESEKGLLCYHYARNSA